MLLSSSNRKYPTFPLFSYFSVIVCLRCLLHHILSLIVYTFRENREFVFISIVQLMSANSRIRFGLQIVFGCLYITPSHYHHRANFIWRHWTYKMPVRYNLSSVWVRLSIFSQLSIIQYVVLCVFSLPISLMMIERIYIPCLIIYIKSEVWTISHCLGLGLETMICAVCLSIFLLSTIDNITVVLFAYISILHLDISVRMEWMSLDWKAVRVIYIAPFCLNILNYTLYSLLKMRIFLKFCSWFHGNGKIFWDNCNIRQLNDLSQWEVTRYK